jgi:hypothetical protein
MQFSGARLKSEKGEVIADNVSGAVTLPKRETEHRWGGRFEFESVHEVMALLSRSDQYFELDIPSVLKAKIVLKNAAGDFLGSGNPKMYA